MGDIPRASTYKKGIHEAGVGNKSQLANRGGPTLIPTEGYIRGQESKENQRTEQ